jgi:nicotinamide mononucleotide transporter
LEQLASWLGGVSPWESAAVLSALAYLILAARESNWCWCFAFASTAIYSVLFWDVSLLMESALNVYYMAMAVYGWYQWRRGGSDHGGIEIHTLGAGGHGLMIGAILLLSITSGYLLSRYSSAVWPYLDSLTTWASVIATFMVARKILENWLYWIVIDLVSIPLYLNRGLEMTALLFAAYVIIAVLGFFRWRQHYRQQVWQAGARCAEQSCA